MEVELELLTNPDMLLMFEHGIRGGAIISWILNRAADVVGWISQNLWALVVGVGGLIYMYMVTKK